MRRLRVFVAALLGTALVPGGLAVAASGARPQPQPQPRAQLSRVVCHRALDPAARYVSVAAVMRPLPGTEHLAVRFDLLFRLHGSARFSAVSAPGLGDWVSPSDPTLGQRPGDVWRVVKPVADLAAPAAYRFAVDFRWTGAGGRVLGSARRVSRVCFQPELRPDLVVRSITVSPVAGRPSVDAYLVTIANTGRTAAGPFTVAFTDAAGERDKVVQRLAPRSVRRIRFVGSLCQAASPPSVTVDPQQQVDVYSRAQATLVATCQ